MMSIQTLIKCHDKCVAKAIISRLRNPKNRNTSRPTNHSKSVLGKPPSLDSKATIAITVAPASPPKNVVPPSAFTKTKANSSYRWQKWIYNTLGFKWMPKIINVCMSLIPASEPSNISGSTSTSIPSVSSVCNAGDTDHSLDC